MITFWLLITAAGVGKVRTISHGVQGGPFTDRAFCVRTDDGGRTFQRLGHMLPENPDVRSVMPTMALTRVVYGYRAPEFGIRARLVTTKDQSS